MEKLGLGPADLCTPNPRLIYARLTGFGQTGPLAAAAGHDLNYVAQSGVLSLLGRQADGRPPAPPVNLLADMAGGGLLCAFGICAALLERERSGRGQVVDAAMTEGAAYVGAWLTRGQRLMPIWGAARGANVLDGGRFYYQCYETSEPGRYMSVAALEPQFFERFRAVLGRPELTQAVDTEEENEAARRVVAKCFAQRTQAEWTRLFAGVDACVSPVLGWEEAVTNAHNRERGVYVDPAQVGGETVAAPAPRLSRTPAVASALREQETRRSDGNSWIEVLAEVGVEGEELRRLYAEGGLILPEGSKL